MAWVLMPTMIAPIAGPLVGGFLTTVLSWRWIFYVNVPVGVLGIVMALVLLRDEPDERRGRFDLVGLLLSGVALSSLVTGLELLVRGAASALMGGALLAFGLVALFAYLHGRARPRRRRSILACCRFRPSGSPRSPESCSASGSAGCRSCCR